MKKIYFIGIEGAGTSALAIMYSEMGHEVMGSDDGDHFYRDVLMQKNITVFDNFSKKNLPEDIDLVIHSTAFKKDNPEMEEAISRGIKILSYPQALGELFNKKMGIAVCGTHGKTTTTSILSEVMKGGGMNPSAIVGSTVLDWKSNSLFGKGDYFIIEADEYQNKLAFYDPWSVILTSVDFDHPDFYLDFPAYKKAFLDFVEKIPKHGFLIFWGDSRTVEDVAENAKCKKLSFGFNSDNDYIISNLASKTSEGKFRQKFSISFRGKEIGEFEINLPGKHNALNASSAIALCHQLEINLEKIKESLAKFQGTARRFQFIGNREGALLIDDYAHHPEEVKAALRAARELYPDKKITVLFHPHSFTRTEALLEEFSQSFDDATKVFVLDIYGSAREESGNVSSQDLIRKINRYSPGKAEYIPTIKDATEFFAEKIRGGEMEILISMGAGDVWKVTHNLVKNKY